MSLILDALKKSEAERQRQTGPTLLEVRVIKPQRRYPLWALGVGILLLVNMVLLLVFVLRPTDSSRAPTAASGPGAVTYAPASAAANVPPNAPANAPIAAVPAPAAAVPAAALPPQMVVPPQSPATSAAIAPTLSATSDTDGNPADEEPAISASAASLRGQRDSPRTDYSTLPGINDVSGNVPDLRLDLHVYAERPRDRYALINMQTVHEGDMLREGARVLAITREGVALEWRNQQFMLRPQ